MLSLLSLSIHNIFANYQKINSKLIVLQIKFSLWILLHFFQSFTYRKKLSCTIPGLRKMYSENEKSLLTMKAKPVFIRMSKRRLYRRKKCSISLRWILDGKLPIYTRQVGRARGMINKPAKLSANWTMYAIENIFTRFLLN